jgi:aminoglycoside phosphotransferase family enzyme/predicted kinase
VDHDAGTRVVQTHVSRLFFVEDRVVKVKLPVRNEFLDLSTVAARAQACRREVELNRRLSPDVYLGVIDISLDGRTVEHGVLMRRLPEARRLSALLGTPEAPELLREVVQLVVGLHQRAERGPEIDEAASPASMSELWRTGVEQLRDHATTILDETSIARVELLAHEYLDGRRALVEHRIACGCACDGHGDLQADDIFCLDDGPRILDCLEFDDHLRHGDVLSDIAFLAMDLDRRGHPALARQVLEDHRRWYHDDWPGSLAAHHMAYRAHVRAKVACLRHSASGDPADAAEAQQLQRRCVEHLEAGRVLLVLVGGGPGSGKTTLARALGRELGATVLSSDELRDELLPRSVGSDAVDGGRYAPELVDRIYDAMLERAEHLAGMGEHVVLDASWTSARRRDAAGRLAERSGAVEVPLRCDCPDGVAEERVRRRAALGEDASEATVEVARHLATSADAWPEATIVPTEGTPERSLLAALDAVEAARTR